MKRRVAFYARVSTLVHGQDPRVQLRDMLQYAATKDWELTYEYVDKGFSGGKSSRPSLDLMMADARAHKFDIVLVWKFDRFARSVSHLIAAVDEFKSLGIDFVSLTEQVDTTTPTGKLIFTVIAGMAEFERSLTQERVNAGLRHARAMGRKLGRPRRLKITQDDVLTAIHVNHGSKRKAAVTLGISPRMVYELLHHPRG